MKCYKVKITTTAFIKNFIMVISKFCFSTDGDGCSQNRKCLQLKFKNDFFLITDFVSQGSIS